MLSIRSHLKTLHEYFTFIFFYNICIFLCSRQLLLFILNTNDSSFLWIPNTKGAFGIKCLVFRKKYNYTFNNGSPERLFEMNGSWRFSSLQVPSLAAMFIYVGFTSRAPLGGATVVYSNLTEARKWVNGGKEVVFYHS